MRNVLLHQCRLGVPGDSVSSAQIRSPLRPCTRSESSSSSERRSAAMAVRVETCHSQDTGTVSPQDAQKRFKQDPNDPLFLHDGSDDGAGQWCDADARAMPPS